MTQQLWAVEERGCSLENCGLSGTPVLPLTGPWQSLRLLLPLKVHYPAYVRACIGYVWVVRTLYQEGYGPVQTSKQYIKSCDVFKTYP